MHTLERRSVKDRIVGRSLDLIPFKAFSDSEVWGILSFLVDPVPRVGIALSFSKHSTVWWALGVSSLQGQRSCLSREGES